MSVALSMIAAVAENGVIGAGTSIPWRIPSDMAMFKRTTMGKPVIMGRKQFEIFNRPLPGRTNLVVSRREGYQPEGVIVINDLVAAIDHARTIATAEGAGEAIVIGGAEIYAQAMPFADRLYISHVALRPEGDAFFPEIDPKVWKVVAEPDVVASPKDEAGYVVRIHARRSPGRDFGAAREA